MAPTPNHFAQQGVAMKHRTFFWFILPTLTAMILFIALPIVSVMIQSLFVQHEQVLVISKSCGPFGCQETTSIDTEATAALREAQPLGRFNGLGTYFDRSHLATAEVAEIWRTSEGLGSFLSGLMDLKFYKAMIFTLTYTFTVTLGFNPWSGCCGWCEQFAKRPARRRDFHLSPPIPCGDNRRVNDPVVDGRRRGDYWRHLTKHI